MQVLRLWFFWVCSLHFITTPMLVKTHAIVLRSLKYGDNQLITDLLTEAFGRVSFVSSIPRTQKAKIKKQLFQPLTLLEIEFDHRPNARLQRLRDARMTYPFTSIPYSEAKLAIALFVAEFLSHATRDEQQNVSLYKYVETSVRWLDGAQHALANFHLAFMIRLSRFLGFYPNLDDYTRGCLFDLRSGCFVASIPMHNDYLQPDDAAQMANLMRITPQTMHLFGFSHHERNRCTQLAINFYRLHIPSFPELKSFDVLRAVYGE